MEEKERKIDGAAFDAPEEEQKCLSQECSISKVPFFAQHVSVCIPNLNNTYELCGKTFNIISRWFENIFVKK